MLVRKMEDQFLARTLDFALAIILQQARDAAAFVFFRKHIRRNGGCANDEPSVVSSRQTGNQTSPRHAMAP